jgi:preprotein translocase subunit SecD
LSQFKDKEIQLVIDNAYANFTIDFTGKNHLTIVHYISEPSTQTIQQAIDYLDNATYTETTIREQEDDVIREQLSGVDRRTEMITSTGDGTKYLADDGTYKTVSGGTSTDVQINGTSITSNNTANILTQSAYDASTNKIATVSDIKNITVGANSGLAISNTNVLSFDNKL